MTAVVSDTSPLNYLCLIDAIEVLPALFSEVLIPPSVSNELRHPRAPKAVAAWLQSSSPWLRQQAPTALHPGVELHPGESEAISLAMELKLHAILIDEAKGTEVAENVGLTPIGTISILVTADAHGLLDLEVALNRLRATNFYAPAATIDSLIEEARARKRDSP